MEENNMNRNYGEDNSQADYNQPDSEAQYSGSQPDNGYQNESYQTGGDQRGGYQTDGYQNNGYQNGSYQNDSYQNSSCQNSSSQNNAYQTDSYQNNGYTNGGYSGNGYPNAYQPYNNVPPYGNDQLELEEPVKVSEWVLALVLMMIPCVNIIMMFVWAFSSTEKKSKSNFFKAYLIFFAIAMALVVLMWLGILLFALALS